MRPRKNTNLIMLLALLLIAFTAGIAQTPSQGDQKKKTETCCAMESCCCNNGSCDMKKDGATEGKDGSCCSGDSCDMKMKDKAAKNNHSGDHDCSSCCGDSCDMNMKHDATMKHDMKMKHDKDAKGECCNMKHKDKNKTGKKAA